MFPLPGALSLRAKINTHSLVFVILVQGIQFGISQMVCKTQPLTHVPHFHTEINIGRNVARAAEEPCL